MNEQYLDLISKVIDLNPGKSISESIAQRQTNVVASGFGRLHESGQYLYVADEVGLGKTYIALGIAAMLRRFSPHPEKHTEMILMPKANLQEKWEKEIRLFTRNNYRHSDNIVRTVIDEPVAAPVRFQDLRLPKDYGPNCFLFRNSSFSLGSSSDGEDRDGENRWADRLREKLANPELIELFERGKRDYSGSDKTEYLKKLFAYLLNHALPGIDLLIVDEAHNFKHGLHRSSSIRNKLLPRFLGTIWPGCGQRLRDSQIFDENDECVFRDFPVLRDSVRPKVKRLLLLSATPMDKGLHEIRNQLDVFMPTHPYQTLTDDECQETIRNDLPSFLIRGIMDVTLGGKRLSRNIYRHEHRNGNVEKHESAPPLRVGTDKDGIILGLVQHKIISHLQRNGGMYELGLLGAFESYTVDAGSEAEIDTVASRRKNAMIDREILHELNESYRDVVGDDLPHPKQDSLIKALFELMTKGEKSLVFVRRIGSVRELDRKLSRRYLSFLMEKVQSVLNPSMKLRGLIEAYNDMKITEAAEHVIEMVCERIIHPLYDDMETRKNQLVEILNEKGIDFSTYADNLNQDLMTIYLDEKSRQAPGSFTESCDYHARRGRFQRLDKNLPHNAVEALLHYYRHEDIDNDEERDEDAHDFLNRYFSRIKFKKNRLNRQNWLHPNMYLLHRAFSIFDVNYGSLYQGEQGMEGKSDSAKAIAAEKTLESAILKEEPTLHGNPHEVHEHYRTDTFMTELLTDICRQEMDQWLGQVPIKPLVEEIRKSLNSAAEATLYSHIQNLCSMLRATFAHGSGLLLVFIADSQEGEFTQNMRDLLDTMFPNVLEEVRTIIRDYHVLLAKNFRSPEAIPRILAQQSPVVGVSGQHKINVSRVASQFRMPGYPYVVVATDILKEGEDLHTYCSNVFHYGIAWNPSDMEQRTGRIDRIGSQCEQRLSKTCLGENGEVPFEARLQVFFPYLADTLEVNQMSKLFGELDNFVEVFYQEAGKPVSRADAYVAVDETCQSLPPQKRDLLQSRYDYDQFKGCLQNNVPAYREHSVGLTRDAIETALEDLKSSVIQHPHVHLARVERNVPRLVGTFAVNDGRQAQYFVSVEPRHGNQLGQFAFRLGAIVCNYNAQGVRKAREHLENVYGYSCRRIQDSLVAELAIDSLDPVEANTLLYELAERADKAELEHVGGDNAEQIQ